MRTLNISSAINILLIGTCLVASAQDKAAIEQKLNSQYALTKATADKTDIVTAGAILVLQKDNLMMVDATASNMFQNSYKDGKITQNALGKLAGFGRRLPGAQQSGPAQRTFVAGEKMWLTKIDVKDNSISLELFTDAINEVRYRAVLSFPFKGPMPPAQQAERMVAEVFKVQPSEEAGDKGQQQQPQQQQQAAPAAAPRQQAAPEPIAPPPPPPADTAPAPIPPPPPPAEDAGPPKTISLGQTTDQVVANFGQPQKIAKVGTKEIYYYKDLKVTFVAGKVTDVQ